MQTYINMIPFLFRYIRSGHMEETIDWESIVDNVVLEFNPTDMIKDDAMELRSDEPYVSFFGLIMKMTTIKYYILLMN